MKVIKYGFKDKYIKPCAHPQGYTDEEIAIIQEMAKAPKNTYDINDVVDRVGMPKPSAYRIIKQLGVSDRFTKNRYYTESDIAELVEICKTAKTKNEAKSQIRKRFPKMSSTRINTYLNQYNPHAISINDQRSRLDSVIKEYYSSKGPTWIHNNLLQDIPVDSIINRASALGISYEALGFIDEYKGIIEANYPIYGTEIIKLFNLPISKSSLYSYTSRNNIKYNDTYSKSKNPKIIQIVRDNIYDSAQTICDIIDHELNMKISN